MTTYNSELAKKHNEFGEPCGGSRWFSGTLKIDKKRMVPVQLRWMCPIDDCDGEMKFNGMTWPTGDTGYHHSCNKCGFTAAIRGERYPRIGYEEVA